MVMGNNVWDHCPECKCKIFKNRDALGVGYRVCVYCNQEWWTDIDYNRYDKEDITSSTERENRYEKDKV